VSDRLAEAFERASGAALIGYLPAGFPSAPDSVRLIKAMVAVGVDVIEIGLPYSDPLMDGPDIQQAVDLALRDGTTTDVVLETVAEVTRAGATALVMSYWNPIERYGIERFATRLADAGGVGVITPDLTPEEASDWAEVTDATGLRRVFLVAPSSTDERIAIVAGMCSGFVYAASTMGVTGVRAAVGSGAPQLVERTRAQTELPVAVGIGVSSGSQAREVAQYADGVIVGSAFVRSILQSADVDEAEQAVRRLAQDLSEGVRGR